MALIVTPGGSTSDSYISLAEADALAAADLGPEVTAWGAASDADQEKALRRATREIDGYLRSGWARYAGDQALLFPRAIDVDASSDPLIPIPVKRATYEQATYVLKNAAVLDNAAMRRARGFQSASEPDVSYSEGDDEANVISPAALLYLVGYRRASGSRAIRSVRMASGYSW